MPQSSPIDPQYLDAIKGFEGFAPVAVWDYKQNSNGYGTKAAYPGEKIDQATAEQRFNEEVAKAAAVVDGIAPNAPPGVKAALTSLTYNAGPAWTNSGLGELIRAGDFQGAKDRFLQYNKAGGQVLPGLADRRSKEAAWFDAAPPLPPPVNVGLAPPIGAPAPPRIADSQPAPGAFNQVAPTQTAPAMPAYGWSPQDSQQAAPEQPQMPSFGGPMQMPQMRRPPPPDIQKLLASLQAPGLTRRGFY